MRKNYFVYIIECSDKSYYIGITNNLVSRINEHNNGLNPYSYTFSRRPVQLVYFQEFFEVKEAILFEKKIKGWSRAKKKALIEGRMNDLPVLSKNSKDSSTGSE